ncbi:UNVERIFIED_CONTAM: hypothetical protein HDU68_010925 [Siphonaria sp. JEL0065]|nr:hypothetical protein HDU68_010925 [Siphonaria sp. JEL0065]
MQNSGSALSVGQTVLSKFTNANIEVALSLTFSLPASTSQNMAFMMKELKRVDPKYILLLSQNSDDSAFIYYKAYNNSLVGSDRVWITNFSPAPSMDYGGINASQKLQGVVVIQPLPSHSTTEANFNSQWIQLNQQNATGYPVTNNVPAANIPGSYDCVKAMVSGLIGFANANSVRISELPSMRPSFVPSVFSNTGAMGYIASPIQLSSTGDLVTGYYFSMLSANQTTPTDSNAIAVMNVDGFFALDL